MRRSVAFAASAAFLSLTAHGHSGGTDANGCHAGSQPYHCPNSKGGDGALAVLAGVIVIAVIWYVVDRSPKRRSATRLAASPENDKATEPLPLDSEASKPTTGYASVCVPTAQDPALRTRTQEVVRAAMCREEVGTVQAMEGQT